MCISPAVCKKNTSLAFTLAELIIVLIIIGITATISVLGFHIGVKNEYEKNAKIKLEAIYSAEQDYFAWKNNYTADWTALNMEDPNANDAQYTFTIESASQTGFSVKASAKTANAVSEYTIDQTGVIQKVVPPPPTP
jgi:prepilin-type N-terminal cleavage/methylation domain-containing protein